MDTNVLRDAVFVLALLFYMGVMGSFGSAITEEKGWDADKGASLAIFLPVLGLLILLLLPARGTALVRRRSRRLY
jgi:hypothetical protein